MSYRIDYLVNSSTCGGTKVKGTVYIRGVKSETGYDSFKFCLEKNTDFAELDSDILLGAIEQLFKMQQPEPTQERNDPPRFQAKNAKKKSSQ